MQFGIASAKGGIGRALGGPAALAPVHIARPDDFWRIYGADDYYSCVPSVVRPVDPAIMRALHSFYPGAIHIEVRQKWLPPHSSTPILVRYHALGERVQNPDSWHPPFYCEMPANPTHPVPNVIQAVMMGDDRPDGGPATFEPFDGGMLARLRRTYNEHRSAKELTEILKRQYEAKLAHRERMAAERKRFEGQLSRDLAKKLVQFSDVEWAEYYRGQGKRKREPKPFVDFGG